MHASSPRRRFLSVWLRRLTTDRIARASPAPAETPGDRQPLVVVADIKSARRIVAMNDRAAKLGLKTGTTLADARAMYPALAAAEADPEADHALLHAIGDWAGRYSPLIGLDRPDGLLLDISGCAHLFSGEEGLCRDLTRRLVAQGFKVRIAAADSVGCAWAVAHYGTPSLIESGRMRETLAPLPLAALRLAPDAVAALAQVGLKRIADVLDLPRAPLAARFGEILPRRLDQALGREEESIVPLLPVPSYMAERRFADPIAREEDVLGTIGQLAGELVRLLERQGEGARLLEAALFRADGQVKRIAAGTSEAVRDPVRIRRVFAERLAALADEYDPGFGFDMIRLSALTAERLDPMQSGFGHADDGKDLAHLIDRLSARLGADRVMRLMPQDTHIPEFAMVETPANEGRPPSIRSDGSAQDSLAPSRPLRLFERPEPIEAVAEVPDGPPVRFRWRRVLHEIAETEGPERIAMEWWRDDHGNMLTRDYFRVETREGARFWVYRQGLYDREQGRPGWFLHGLFA